MGRVLLILASVLVLASCSGSVGAADCEAEPLPNPVFEIEGAGVPDSGYLQLGGKIEGIAQAGGRFEITLSDDKAGRVTLTLVSALPMKIDLRIGTDIEVDYWQRQGFEGTARGLRIHDGSGTVLIAEDGDYGTAILAQDLAPFTVTQADAGCRNRENRPGALNNFKLVVAVGDASLELMHGEEGRLRTTSVDYTVVGLRSVASVGDVSWTDAPYEYTSYVIARVP